jgi:hypothetical protein
LTVTAGFADNSSFLVKAQGCGVLISNALTWVVDSRCDPKEVEERLDRCSDEFYTIANKLEEKYDHFTMQIFNCFKTNDHQKLKTQFFELMTGTSEEVVNSFIVTRDKKQMKIK